MNSVTTLKKYYFHHFSSPVEHILFLQRKIGNQAVVKHIQSGTLRAELKIGRLGDIYELEVDRVAEQLIRMLDSLIQRKFCIHSRFECRICRVPICPNICG